MTSIFTLDASVWVAATKSIEPGHQSSVRLLEEIQRHGIPMVEPRLLLVEVAAALARSGATPRQATEYAHSVAAVPRLTLLDLDAHLAAQAVHWAARLRLRGADAVYLATAAHYGSTLVTLDREQLLRATGPIRAATPADAVAALPKPPL
jgi:predicted nucleic acid-binding protein